MTTMALGSGSGVPNLLGYGAAFAVEHPSNSGLGFAIPHSSNLPISLPSPLGPSFSRACLPEWVLCVTCFLSHCASVYINVVFNCSRTGTSF